MKDTDTTVENESGVVITNGVVERSPDGRFIKGFPAEFIKDAGRKGWWELPGGEEKMARLKMAFSFGATDIEAVAFAELSLDNLYYFQKKHPDFTTEKKMLKSQVLFKARKNIIDRIKAEDVADANGEVNLAKAAIIPATNSWAYMKSHSDEFAERIDPNIGKKTGNIVVLTSFEDDDDEIELDETATIENQ